MSKASHERGKKARIATTSPSELKRSVGLGGAVVLGLGSIVGTGAFVSLGLAAGSAGAWLPMAVALAGLLATCNGMSSAQLAAHMPRSGGTYLYASRLLHPMVGLTAGAMFLVAKSASAATAALGVASYGLGLLGDDWSTGVTAIAAAGVVLAMTALVLGGLRRSNAVNGALVGVTVAGLAVFVVGAVMHGGWTYYEANAYPPLWMGLPEATALCFVAYTGYGRVATLGEEIREPRKSIPRAVVLTLVVSAVLYVAVSWSALYAVGAGGFAGAVGGGATLENVLTTVGASGWVVTWVSFAAIAAMLGVLLNLLLGLSRVALAMGRQGDLPAWFARLDRKGQTPVAAVVGVAGVILLVVATGSVEAAWSFSAVTVLIYYGLTNLAALRLKAGDRLAPRWVSMAGLVGCLGLALFVDPPYLIAGAVVAGGSAAWYVLARLFGGEARVG